MNLKNRPILFSDFKKNREVSLQHIKDVTAEDSEYAITSVTTTVADLQNHYDQLSEQDVVDICVAMINYPPSIQFFLLGYFTHGRSVDQDDIGRMFKEFVDRNPVFKEAMESSLNG